MFEIVQMRAVIAFEFEAGAVSSKCRQDMLDIAERVAKDDVAIGQIVAFPFMP